MSDLIDYFILVLVGMILENKFNIMQKIGKAFIPKPKKPTLEDIFAEKEE